MSRRYRTNDGEWQSKRNAGTDDLPLFAGETGIDAPPAKRESGEAERERVITALGDEEKRRDWIDRIHSRLTDWMARGYFGGIATVNEARDAYQSFPDADPSIDFRFLAALWKRPGWIFVDWEGKSQGPKNHARRIARYRYERPAEVK